MMLKRVFLFSLMSCLALFGMGCAGQSADETIEVIRSAQVARGVIRSSVSATGAVQPEALIRLSFGSSGRVLNLLVAQGQTVQAGDLLAELNTPELSLSVRQAEENLKIQELTLDQRTNPQPTASRLAAAEADVQVAEANLAIAESNLISAEANFVIADSRFSDSNEIGKANLDIVQASVNNARNSVEIAKANVQRATAALDALTEPLQGNDLAILEAQVSNARTNLELAQLRLEQSQIIAPVGGRIANVTVEVGEQASPGAPAITLLSEGEYHLDVSVDEIDIEKVTLGQAVNIVLDAVEGVTLQGEVADIAPVAGVGGGGVVTYLVTINIKETEGVNLRAGLTATADIITKEVADVVLVPNWAVRLNRETGEAFVNVQSADGTITEKPITTGLRDEQFTELLSGLAVGDTVVVTNARDDFSLFGGGN